jgi:hypothetical protein
MGLSGWSFRYTQWMASVVAIFPIALQLFWGSLAWPHNWDDFMRGYNGVAPSHPILGYGLLESRSMMKLAIHDPLLTITNRLDILSPVSSGLLEVILIIIPFLLLSRLSCRNADISLASSLLVAPVSLIAIQHTFLPPSAYPLAFTLAFSLATLASYLNDWRGLAKLPLFYRLVLWSGEQIAFLFYACCFLQGLTFWFLSLVYRFRAGHGRPIRLYLLSLLRFVPFLAISFLWRLTHPVSKVEQIALVRSPAQPFIAILKWLLNGTSLGAFFGASGLGANKVTDLAVGNLPLVLLCLLVALAVPLVASHACSQNKIPFPGSPQLNSRARVGRNLVLILGISISIGWLLPVASSRYMNEMQSWGSQVYVASRYTGLGVALLLAAMSAHFSDKCLVRHGRLLRLSRAQDAPISWVLYRSLLWLVPLIAWTLVFNSFSLTTHVWNGTLPSLQEICAGHKVNAATIRAVIPLEVLGGDTSVWLFTLPRTGEYSRLNTDDRASFISERFNRNLLRLCD